MRFEERRVRRVLMRNTALFFAAFAVLFALFGVLIFQMVSSSIYRSADDQLAAVAALPAAVSLDRANVNGDDGYQIESAEGAASVYSEKKSDGQTDAEVDADAADDAGEAPADDFGYGNALITSEIYVAQNPQLIYVWRNAAGEAVDTQGIYAVYPSYFADIPFDAHDLDRPYEVRAGEHAYRGMNFAMLDDGTGEDAYLQVLVNVDSEIALLDHFTKVLVIYLAAAVLAAAAVSYLLSRKTIKPIVASMNRQTEFVQNASHELRTPLAVIRASQERLLAAPMSRVVDRFEDVSASIDETKRLARLVDDLMTLTTADAPVSDERPAEPLDVRAVVADVGERYADLAEVAGRELAVRAQPAGEACIDEDALRQVLGVLLDNALKYTAEGDAIELACEERGGRVEVRVADTGCGIALDDRERVFERFYRADAARTTPGSGLGLSIARVLVERAGGTIVAEGNEPRGTRIVVSLPKKRTG